MFANSQSIMEKWNAKVAIVTGASSGIGAAITKKLAEHGLTVVGFARRSYLVEIAAAGYAEYPGKVVAWECNLENETDCIDCIRAIVKKHGPVHMLVNCAGIMRRNTIIHGDTEAWEKVLQINVLAACIVTREVVESMNEHGIHDGHIVNVNCMAGRKVVSQTNMLTASKFALAALTDVMRWELLVDRSRIKVSSITAGWVDTEMFKQMPIYIRPVHIKWLEPDDVAKAVCFIVSRPAHVLVCDLKIKPMLDPL